MVDTSSTVVIKGRNELSYAVAQAERDLKRLTKQGEIIGKLFRGGALVGAIVAFERLAHNAEEAATKIGDKGTAQALKQLNAEIDRLKSKGLNVIGQVLGSVYINYRGTEAQKLQQDIAGIRQEMERLLQSSGGNRTIPGFVALEQRLDQLSRKLREVQELERTFTARRSAAVSRGGGSGVLTRYSPAFDEEPAKFDPMSGLGDLNIWQRPIFNLYNAQQEAFAELNAEMREDSRQFLQGFQNDSFETTREVGEWFTEMGEEARRALSGMTVFAEQAGRNIQDAFATFLFDPFKGGLDDMLGSFVDTIRRMVAELAASELLRMFFTWGSGLGGGIGKLSGALLKGLASGGPVMGGVPVVVGEKGPEVFVPRTAGSIVPNGAGGVVLNQSIHLDARGGDADRIAAMLPAWGRALKAATISEVRDLISRGKLA